MAGLEDLKPGASVRGILPTGLVTVVGPHLKFTALGSERE
jgi:hypothetical protein